MRRLYWPVLRRLRRLRNLCCRLSKPGFEARLPESSVIARNQCFLTEFRPRVTSVWISDDFAGIFERGQPLPDQFIHAKLFRASNFDDAVHRRAYRDSSHGTCDIVGGHRLEEHRWQMHFALDHGNVSEALEKFKELRRVNDRVGDRRFFDQLFLSDLSAEVTAFSQPFARESVDTCIGRCCYRFVSVLTKLLDQL